MNMTQTDKTARSILDYKQMLRPNGTLTEDAGQLLASFGFADLQRMAKLWLEVGDDWENLGRCSVCKKLDIADTWCGDTRQQLVEHQWGKLDLEAE